MVIAVFVLDVLGHVICVLVTHVRQRPYQKSHVSEGLRLLIWTDRMEPCWSTLFVRLIVCKCLLLEAQNHLNVSYKLVKLVQRVDFCLCSVNICDKKGKKHYFYIIYLFHKPIDSLWPLEGVCSKSLVMNKFVWFYLEGFFLVKK